MNRECKAETSMQTCNMNLKMNATVARCSRANKTSRHVTDMSHETYLRDRRSKLLKIDFAHKTIC